MPDSLHALLAARLDALDPLARSLAADAAVLGTSLHGRDVGRPSGAGRRPGPRGAGRAGPPRRAPGQRRRLSPQLGSYSFTHGLLARWRTRRCRTATSRGVTYGSPPTSRPRRATKATRSPRSSRATTSTRSRPPRRRRRRRLREAAGLAHPSGRAAPGDGHPGAASRLFASAAELVDVAGESGALSSPTSGCARPRPPTTTATSTRRAEGHRARGRAAGPAGPTPTGGAEQRASRAQPEPHGDAERKRDPSSLLPWRSSATSPDPTPSRRCPTWPPSTRCSSFGRPRGGTSIGRPSSSRSGSAPSTHCWSTSSTHWASPIFTRGRRLRGQRPLPGGVAPGQGLRGSGSWRSAPRATSATWSCATTRGRPSSTPTAARVLARQIEDEVLPGRSTCSTHRCACSGFGEWDRAAAVVEAAIDDDDLGDFVDPARAAALVWALRGDSRPGRARSSPRAGATRWRTRRTWPTTPTCMPS